MEAIELLKEYKIEVDPVLKKYFRKKLKQAEEIDPLAKQAVQSIADFTLAAGKRIRPAMVYYGYLAAGGKKRKEIIEASMGIELIHSFLLIHDDFMDRDDKRHGIDTIHEKYKKIGKIMAPEKDNAHFGNSMAVTVGDMASTMGYEIIFNADFSAERIIKALDKLQNIVNVTIPGQLLDVVMENRGYATEKEILRMFEGKTSRYTFEGPLHLGAILAGADEKILRIFTKYSLPLGKAFQIRDDILGIFGNEKILGKPVGSDITEGKQTLLFLKALEKSDKKQKNILYECLGRKDLKKEKLDEFRKVIKDTGALEYCQNLAEKFANESLQALKKINFKNQKAKIFLSEIVKFIVSRTV
jgi:geranylgeranyl diphosphate synthase type I